MALRAALRAGYVMLSALGSFHSASAFVGPVDRQTELPFGVKLSIEFRADKLISCSGVVHGYIGSAAARCLYDTDGSLARKVTIQYIDALGSLQTITSTRIYVFEQHIHDRPEPDFVAQPEIGYVVFDTYVVVSGSRDRGLKLLRDVSP